MLKDTGQIVYIRASLTKQHNLVLSKWQWCSTAGKVTADLAVSNSIMHYTAAQTKPQNQPTQNYVLTHTARYFNLVLNAVFHPSLPCLVPPLSPYPTFADFSAPFCHSTASGCCCCCCRCCRPFPLFRCCMDAGEMLIWHPSIWRHSLPVCQVHRPLGTHYEHPHLSAAASEGWTRNALKLLTIFRKLDNIRLRRTAGINYSSTRR